MTTLGWVLFIGIFIVLHLVMHRGHSGGHGHGRAGYGHGGGMGCGGGHGQSSPDQQLRDQRNHPGS